MPLELAEDSKTRPLIHPKDRSRGRGLRALYGEKGEKGGNAWRGKSGNAGEKGEKRHGAGEVREK